MFSCLVLLSRVQGQIVIIIPLINGQVDSHLSPLGSQFADYIDKQDDDDVWQPPLMMVGVIESNKNYTPCQ